MDFLRQYFRDDVAPAARDQSNPKLEELVHGDDDQLNKKKTKTKKKVHFESKPLFQSDMEKSSSYQIKILMRKEAAVGLLSKCKEGGVLELKDVADHVLLGLPTPHRVHHDHEHDVSNKKDI